MFRLACVVTALLLHDGDPRGGAVARGRRRSDAGPVRGSGAVGARSRTGSCTSSPRRSPAARPSPFGDVPVRARDVMWLAASPAQVAVQLRDFDSPSAPGRLYAAGPDGAFRQLAGDVGEEPFDPLWPPVSVTDAGRLHAGGDADAALPAGREDRGRAPAGGRSGLRRRRRRRGRGVDGRRADRLRPALGHRAAPDLARALRRAGHEPRGLARRRRRGDHRGRRRVRRPAVGARGRVARARARDARCGWRTVATAGGRVAYRGFEPPRRGRAGDDPRRRLGADAVPRARSPRRRTG